MLEADDLRAFALLAACAASHVYNDLEARLKLHLSLELSRLG